MEIKQDYAKELFNISRANGRKIAVIQIYVNRGIGVYDINTTIRNNILTGHTFLCNLRLARPEEVDTAGYPRKWAGLREEK